MDGEPSIAGSVILPTNVKQVSTPQLKKLEEQGYRFVGHHSAVKTCHWTRNMLRGKGGCYKYKFYGIRSHQCMQMTTSMFCANRCTFCWRGEKAPVSKDWYGPVDKPEDIIKESVQRHLDLLVGFKGREGQSSMLFNQSEQVRHVALSLTGEPITYPLINEIIKQFHERKISTFLVTNAQYPEQIEKIECITQLYISVDAPNKRLLKEIDRPLFPDYYERLLRSLDIMAAKPYRTVIRLTMVKGVNDTDIDGYKELIERGSPDFIEVKGYVHVGASQKLLKKEDMPVLDEIRAFSAQLVGKMPQYSIVSEHEPSKVILLMKNTAKQYINFPRFFELANTKGTAAKEEYSSDKMCPNE